MPALMATAEYVTKVHAVCTRTGNLANYSFRKTDNEKLVMLGNRRIWTSRAAYYHAMRKDQEENDPLRSPFQGEEIERKFKLRNLKS
jgi:thymidine kinase